MLRQMPQQQTVLHSCSPPHREQAGAHHARKVLHPPLVLVLPPRTLNARRRTLETLTLPALRHEVHAQLAHVVLHAQRRPQQVELRRGQVAVINHCAGSSELARLAQALHSAIRVRVRQHLLPA